MPRFPLVLLFLALVPAALAQHDHAAPAASPPNPAFEKLKSLAGTWSGKAGTKGGDTSEATVTYRLTGGGSALVETLFAGTPHEMVTVYFLDGEQLKLTHYCTAGNQPSMRLTGVDGNTLRFEFVSGTNMKLSDMHMHAASITFLDPNQIVAEWTAWRDGKPAEIATFELSRKP